MNNKYFIIVSTIALLSTGYIIVEKLVNYNNDSVNQYASVIVAIGATSTSPNLVGTSTKYRLPPESPTNYTDNKNGTITDNYTGLIWKKCSQGTSGTNCNYGSPSLREWAKARVECEELNFAGKKGWRLPNLKELQSIVDTGTFRPSINKKFFASSDDPFWTLTSPGEYPASKFTVLFSDGSVYFSSANGAAAIRCVYDGEVK